MHRVNKPAATATETVTDTYGHAIDRHCPNCGAQPTEVCTFMAEAPGGDGYIVTHRRTRHVPCVARLIGSRAESEAIINEASRLISDPHGKQLNPKGRQ